MQVFPLENISLSEAIAKQFALVDCLCAHFTGEESLSRGDLGVKQPANKPLFTMKAEAVLADFFHTEAAVLVRGSGTGAIRYGLSALLNCNQKILIHQAAIYPTTEVSFKMLGLQPVVADFNNYAEIKAVLKADPEIKAALVQISRQKIDDRYDAATVIKTIKETADIPILTDDNYCVAKTARIGAECGADLSCFSAFKLQGPEGIGCAVGKEKYIAKIRSMHYSGGCQVQGWEALEVLRGLTYAPVLFALTDLTLQELRKRLLTAEIPEIKDAYIVNAQSKVLLVEFNKPIAKRVLKTAEKYGALPNPVGSESKYEIAPLFYRVSGTFLKTNPRYGDYMIRINPNRAGAETVLRILKTSITEAVKGANDE